MLITLLILAVLLYGVYALTTYKFDYWKKKKVTHEKPLPLVGNYKNNLLFRKYIGEETEELCYKFRKEPYFGTYYGTEPALVVLDPAFLKLILNKDFYYFSGRETTKYAHNELSLNNVAFQGGDEWKVMRQNLTPMFSTSKLKNMFYLIEKNARELESLVDKEIAKNNNVVETKFLAARYTMGCVGSCIFGVETGTLKDFSADNIFIQFSKFGADSSYKQFSKALGKAIWPAIFYTLNLKLFPQKINTYFRDLLSEIYKSRGYKPSDRNDFVDLFLSFVQKERLTADSMSNSKTGGNKKIEVTVNDDLLVSQSLVLFGAGFDTSAGTSSFLLYELAKKPEVQRKVQAEIDTFLARHNNRVTFDCVTEMPYLDMCVDETLRLYPVIGTLTREVMEDYTFPNGLSLEKGVRIHIPVHYMHRSPDNFPDPLDFRPERFSPENEKNIKPYTYLPFGEGPRLCLGMRFSKMQMYPGLITILKKYNVELAQGMPMKMPLDPKTMFIRAARGIDLKYTPREGWEQRVFAGEN